MSPARVLVVEDHEPLRRQVCSMLDDKSHLQVVSDVADGLEAVQQAKELQPDLVLLDVGLPRLNGIEAARRILKVSPESKILFVSQESSPLIVQEALRLGAHGYIHKMYLKGDLLVAMDAAIRGGHFVSTSLAKAND